MNASVSRPWLLTEPRAVQRRVLKAIGEQAGIPLEFKHIEEILRFAAEDGPAGKELSLPLGWKIRREPEAMVFLTPDLRRQERIPDYEYPLAVPGRALVPELGVVYRSVAVRPSLRKRLRRRSLRSIIRSNFFEQSLLPRRADRAELASGRPVLAGAYEIAEEDQRTAAGAARWRSPGADFGRW